MENFHDAFELFFRDELEGEIAKQGLDADRFEIEFALAGRLLLCLPNVRISYLRS